jgi:hypothetical protein
LFLCFKMDIFTLLIEPGTCEKPYESFGNTDCEFFELLLRIFSLLK